MATTSAPRMWAFLCCILADMISYVCSTPSLDTVKFTVGANQGLGRLPSRVVFQSGETHFALTDDKAGTLTLTANSSAAPFYVCSQESPSCPSFDVLYEHSQNSPVQTDRSIMGARQFGVRGGLFADTIVAGLSKTTAQWVLTEHQDFQDYAGLWAAVEKLDHNAPASSSPSSDEAKALASKDPRQSCSRSGDMFLGGYCWFSYHEVKRIYQIIAVHSEVRLKARVHFFDRWEGEHVYVKVNGNVVWTRHHKHCEKVFSNKCRGINICGDEHYADRLSALVDVIVPSDGDAGALEVVVGSNLQVEPCMASWGLDDVMIYVR